MATARIITAELFLQHTDHGRPTEIIVLHATLTQQDGHWVGVCLELGTSAYASTTEEALQELTDAILLQLDEVEKLGFTNLFLADHNVQRVAVPEKTSHSDPRRWKQLAGV